MINIFDIITILFIHWVADFLCQTDWMATNKSKSNKALLSHVFVYGFIFGVPMCILFGLSDDITSDIILCNVFAFIGITIICHFITDYFTSRLNSKLWSQKKVHWFFVSVGFDQFLHFIQLIITYKLLICQQLIHL